MKSSVWILICLTSSLFLCNCTNHDTAGGTMETENSIALQVRDSLGHPLAGIAARIRPTWYLGDTNTATSEPTIDSLSFAMGIRNVVSDKKGWIVCENLPQGMYRMEVVSDSLAAETEFEHLDTSTARTLGNLYLQATGILQGSIALPSDTKTAWVQLYGSEHKVRTDSTGAFKMPNVPTGIARVIARTASKLSLIAEDLTQVRPNRITQMGQVALPTVYNEDPLTWRHSSVVRVDTLVRDWMLPLSDTAMLTFHLDAPNFDFTQAMSDGRDMRLYDRDGHPLRFERVRWDSTKGKAVIRVAKCFPFDSSEYLTLRWGRPGAIEPDTIGLWKGIPDSVHQYLTKLLVGDFEHGTAKSDFPTFLASTWWYVRTSDSLTTSVPGPYNDIVPAFQNAAPRTGKAAHITYTAAQSHWVLLGVGMGTTPKSLATMDSLVFYAKGNSTMSVAFDNLAGSGTKSWMHLTIDTAWARYTVRPSDLLPSNMATEVRDWNTIQDSVTNLSFLVGNGTEIWIDSVMFYGVGVEDFR